MGDGTSGSDETENGTVDLISCGGMDMEYWWMRVHAQCQNSEVSLTSNCLF